MQSLFSSRSLSRFLSLFFLICTLHCMRVIFVFCVQKKYINKFLNNRLPGSFASSFILSLLGFISAITHTKYQLCIYYVQLFVVFYVGFVNFFIMFYIVIECIDFGIALCIRCSANVQIPDTHIQNCTTKNQSKRKDARKRRRFSIKWLKLRLGCVFISIYAVRERSTLN